MKKTKLILVTAIIAILATVGFFLLSKNNNKLKPINKPESQKSVSVLDIKNTPAEEMKPEPSPENKMCDWIDKSDIIIELSFADGVVKDTSYEAGFYYSKIGSNMRLARSGCNYRTGFSYTEMKNKGAVQVGVRGYSDNNRRQLDNEPVSVIFDENGKPNVSLPIKIKVLN